MSFLDRIVEANEYQIGEFVPFLVDTCHVGWVRPHNAKLLATYADVFRFEDNCLRLAQALLPTSLSTRSEAVTQVLRQLHDQGIFSGWRDEYYPLAASFRAQPELLIERAGMPLLGGVAYGVHLNGVVRKPGAQLHMWVATRAKNKGTAPGKLDQIVAGGQPYGLGLAQNLIKECAEEANIPEDLARQSKAVGAISYVMATPVGLRPDVLFCYDLELPASFEPRNTDGEVDSFELLPVEEVAAIVASSDRFKLNCSLVVIDFLIRWGYLDPDDCDYTSIVRGLQASPTIPLPELSSSYLDT